MDMWTDRDTRTYTHTLPTQNSSIYVVVFYFFLFTKPQTFGSTHHFAHYVFTNPRLHFFLPAPLIIISIRRFHTLVRYMDLFGIFSNIFFIIGMTFDTLICRVQERALFETLLF